MAWHGAISAYRHGGNVARHGGRRNGVLGMKMAPNNEKHQRNNNGMAYHGINGAMTGVIISNAMAKQ
jgi:hypothetical protein